MDVEVIKRAAENSVRLSDALLLSYGGLGRQGQVTTNPSVRIMPTFSWGFRQVYRQMTRKRDTKIMIETQSKYFNPSLGSVDFWLGLCDIGFIRFDSRYQGTSQTYQNRNRGDSDDRDYRTPVLENLLHTFN